MENGIPHEGQTRIIAAIEKVVVCPIKSVVVIFCLSVARRPV